MDTNTGPVLVVDFEMLRRALNAEHKVHGSVWDALNSGTDWAEEMMEVALTAALAQQPVAPQLEAAKVPQPRHDYPNGVLTIKAARDAFPRSHPMFAALDQAASDLAVLDARDRRRKQPAAPSAAVGAEWDMPCGECSCGVYDARAFAAFDGTFPKCKRFGRYCVGAIHCAQAIAAQQQG